MSVKAMNLVWEYSKTHGSTRLVLLAIADHMGADLRCWPSIPAICHKTLLSKWQVQRHVSEIENLGELKVERELGRGNTYRLTIAQTSSADATGTGSADDTGSADATSSVHATQPVASMHQTSSVDATRNRKNRKEPLSSAKCTRPSEAEKKSNPEIKQFIDWWCQEYERRFSTQYVVTGGKDGKTVQRLLKSIPLPELQDLACRFFDDPWANENEAVSITIFGSDTQINKLRRQSRGRHNENAYDFENES